MAVTSEVPPAASSCPATACSGNSPLLLGARAASGQGGGGAGPPAPPLLDARVCQTSRGSGALSPGLRGRTAARGGPHRLLLATERTLGSARPPGLLGSSLLAGERVRELPAPSRHPWRLGRVSTCIPRPHQLLSLLQPVTTCPACRTRGVGAVGKGQNNREPSQQGLRGARGRRAPRPGCRRGATTWGPGAGARGPLPATEEAIASRWRRWHPRGPTRDPGEAGQAQNLTPTFPASLGTRGHTVAAQTISGTHPTLTPWSVRRPPSSTAHGDLPGTHPCVFLVSCRLGRVVSQDTSLGAVVPALHLI